MPPHRDVPHTVHVWSDDHGLWWWEIAHAGARRDKPCLRDGRPWRAHAPMLSQNRAEKAALFALGLLLPRGGEAAGVVVGAVA